MKYLLMSVLVIFSLSALSATHSCQFESDEGEGSIAVDLKGTLAEVVLKYDGDEKKYSKCTISKDEFGKMFDCSGGDIDFMVIVNEDSGGIMSETEKLYEDLDC